MLSHLSPQLDRRRFGYCYCFLLSRRGRTRRLHTDAQRSQTNRKHRVAWIYDFSPFCKRTKLDNTRRRRDSFRPRCKRLPWALSAICAIAKWAGSRPFMGQARWTTQAAVFPRVRPNAFRRFASVVSWQRLRRGFGTSGGSDTRSPSKLPRERREKSRRQLPSGSVFVEEEFNRLESRPGHPSRISSEARPRSSRSSIMAMRISNSEFRRPLSASTQKQPKNVRGAQNNSRLCQYSLPSRASLSAVWQLCPRTRGVRQLRAAQ